MYLKLNLTLCMLQIMSKYRFSQYLLISPLSPLLIYSLKSIVSFGCVEKEKELHQTVNI